MCSEKTFKSGTVIVVTIIAVVTIIIIIIIVIIIVDVPQFVVVRSRFCFCC